MLRKKNENYSKILILCIFLGFTYIFMSLPAMKFELKQRAHSPQVLPDGSAPQAAGSFNSIFFCLPGGKADDTHLFQDWNVLEKYCSARYYFE